MWLLCTSLWIIMNISISSKADLSHVHITPFSFWSIFAPKNGAVFFSVHTTPFSDRNEYLSIGVHTISQKRIYFSLLKKRPSRLLILALKKAPFLVFTLQSCVFVWIRFHLAPFLSSFSFSSVFGVDYCERKAKNGAKQMRFCSKTD